jgi:hypothetical protein
MWVIVPSLTTLIALFAFFHSRRHGTFKGDWRLIAMVWALATLPALLVALLK